MMKSWYEIYRDRMNQQYRDHLVVKYAQFLQALYYFKESTYTEIGCGAGNMTRLLREMLGSDISLHKLVDSCPKMLSLALENNASANCIFQCADIRTKAIPLADVVHSHGLLEHFSDKEIREIVSHCSEAAPVQIHYVPSAQYLMPSRGDERLMTPTRWKEILYGLGKVRVSSFNDGLDLIIRVERR